MTRAWLIIAGLGLALGCAVDPRDADFATSGGGSSSVTAEGTSGAAGDAATTNAMGDTADAADDSDGDAMGGPKLDVGAPDPDAPSAAEHCTAVDLLFVIDNSPSMGQYQEQLAFAFPTFIDEVWATLPPDTDLHVGITTTSFFDGSCSESTMNCATAQTPAEVDAHYMTPSQGSTGVNGEQGRLFSYDALPYFEATVGGDPWPLKIWFAEAAVAAGETGCSYEMSAAGGAYAVAPDNDATNAGFVRDAGAVLAIFFLTDEPDKSPEGAQAYVDMIAAAKTECGGLDCVIAAGLVNECIMGVDNTLWQVITGLTANPVIGSIDDPAGYAGVIGGALAEVIGQTCDEIPPEG